MAREDGPFAELESALRDCLPRVADAADRILAASAAQLYDPHTVWPHRVALRTLALRWRTESGEDLSGSGSWFIPKRESTSARELFRGELDLQVHPVPFGEGAVVPDPSPDAVRLRLPAPVASDARNASLASQLVLRLGEGETLLVRSASGSTLSGDSVRATWTRASGASELAAGTDWPVAIFVRLAAALASADARPGEAVSFARVDASRPLWTLAAAAVRLATTSAALVRREESAPLPDPRLEPLRSDWGLEHYRLRASRLFTRDGAFAATAAEGAYLVPFAVEWSAGAGGAATVALELPDLVVQNRPRALLLEHFAAESDFDAAAELLAESGVGGLAAEAVRGWCDAKRAESVVLRIDRGEDDEFDMDYVLVAWADVKGERAALVLVSRKVVLSYVQPEGEWRVERFKTPRLLFAGGVEDGTLDADAAQLCADALVTLLRWRALLP
jgi:hypothetical protein